MVSRETIAVLLSGSVGTALAVGISYVGGFDEWLGLLTFIYLGLFWYAIPQLYLSLADDAETSGLRVRLIPVILFLLAVAFSLTSLASGRELLVIWGIVAVAVGTLFAAAFRRGYEEATQENSD